MLEDYILRWCWLIVTVMFNWIEESKTRHALRFKKSRQQIQSFAPKEVHAALLIQRC